MKRTVSGIILLIVLLGVLTLAFDIPLAKAAGTIYIRADGSIDPPTANITTSDYVTYTFTDNNYASIMVQRSNIVIDGNGYTLQGSGSGYGIDVVGKSNVEIKNMIIEAFNYGIYLFSFSDFNTVSGNNITANNQYGIYLYSSSNNTISGNNVTANNQFGIYLFSSSNNNAISGNNVTANYYDGICLSVSSNYNVISGNGITANNYFGMGLYSSLGNSISENSITDNGYGFDGYGIALDTSSDNLIYHNNFVNNNKQVKGSNTPNVWDDGYPFGGNCWSDYRTRYPSAVEVDDSLIWNTPYVIDVSNQDNYPLMGPWTSNGENVTVNPASGVYLAFANVTSGGITIVNETQSGPTPLVGYKLEGRYYDVETTASYSSNVTVRTTYEDTSMTQQEEESLLITRWNETMEQWVNITTHVDMVNNVIYGETSHLSIFGVHSLLIHDLSIFGVHASKNTIGQGYPLEILVDVRNEGDFAEDFDVTVDLDSGQISYLSIFGVHLVNAETVTVAFNWNTAESGEGTYLLTAHVSQVAYEIDTSDNTYPDGQVKVTISGDINGDWIVNIADATQIGLWWQKSVPPAPANVDINGNGVINIGDASIIGINWQKRVAPPEVQSNPLSVYWAFPEHVPGDVFTVYIDVLGIEGLISFQSGFRFDPTALQVLEVHEGGFLSNNGADSVLSFPGSIDNINGIVTAYAWLLMDTAKAKYGSGHLMRITFEINPTLWPPYTGTYPGSPVPMIDMTDADHDPCELILIYKDLVTEITPSPDNIYDGSFTLYVQP